MKIFISWSGKRSHEVAKLLKGWIKYVLQGTNPWISSSDIPQGAIWFPSITEQLADTQFGIICLTQDNKKSDWILFETGALLKDLATRACTLLVDLAPQDLDGPLAQFNHTLPTKENMRKLVVTLNNGLDEHSKLEEATLDKVFNKYWPDFETDFQKICVSIPTDLPPARRPEYEMLEELVLNTRDVNQRISALERKIDIQHSQKSSPQEVNYTKGFLKGLLEEGYLTGLEPINISDPMKGYMGGIRSLSSELAATIKNIKDQTINTSKEIPVATDEEKD